jgi:hypothetical protein
MQSGKAEKDARAKYALHHAAAMGTSFHDDFQKLLKDETRALHLQDEVCMHLNMSHYVICNLYSINRMNAPHFIVLLDMIRRRSSNPLSRVRFLL